MADTTTEPNRDTIETNRPQRNGSPAAPARTEPRQALASGTPAPDFSLHTTPDQTVSLADFRGQPLILAFYPADWSPVCSDEVALFNEVLPEFRRHRAELLGISVDGVWCHLAFARDRHLQFPLLADFEPKGDVARRFGVYRGQDGTSERALFVLDEAGTVHWSYVSPIGVNPGVDGLLSALEELSARPSAPPPSAPAPSAEPRAPAGRA